MESYDWLWMSGAALLGVYVLRRINEWYYALKLGKQYHSLPPGHLGWPLLGNFLSFMRAFTSSSLTPDSFITNLVSKYGRTGMYKTHLFGSPSIIVCAPYTCKRVLTDDQNFKLGYPKSTTELARSRPLCDVASADHRRFRRLVTAPIVGHNALAMYLERIEDIMTSSLEELSCMKHPVEVLTAMKKISFKVILHIFIGSENQSIMTKIGDMFTLMHKALFSFPINLPGFAFHKALQARKKLAAIVQPIVDERRRIMLKSDTPPEGKTDLVDILLQIVDETGQKLENEDIMDLLLGFLFAGHESTANGMMWALIYITDHPEVMKKAKEEQEEIMKRRPSSQTRLNIKEVKQMVYLSKVIDEMLRRANIAFSTFREATTDVEINGYIIPKGWRVLVWARAIHMDDEFYPNPLEFNPSRWEDYNAKGGTFLPFGGGSRLCPGNDLAKLEIAVLLHYFLLNYKLERVNPDCPVTYLPAARPTDNCLAKVTKVLVENC